MQLEIDLDDFDLKFAIERASDAVRGSSLSRFFRSGGAEALQARASDRFAAEGDAASGKWPHLSIRTWAIRRSQGFPAQHPINRRTGDLRSWVTSDRGKHANTADSATMIWPGPAPTDLHEDKFETAQVGGGSRGTAPARPVVASNVTDLRLILSGIGHWIAANSDIEVR